MSCSTFDNKNSYKIFNEHLKMHNRVIVLYTAMKNELYYEKHFFKHISKI